MGDHHVGRFGHGRPGWVNAALLEHGDHVLGAHNKSRARGDHNTETNYLGLQWDTQPLDAILQPMR